MQFFIAVKKIILFNFLCILNVITFKQILKRTPEPKISDDLSQVDSYDQVMDSSMAAIYALCLGKIMGLTAKDKDLNVGDFCCGPGHFTKLLNENLKVRKTHGVDLSEPMLEKLKKNNPNVISVKDDLTKLSTFQDKELDLTVAINCLHHMPDLNSVNQALSALERVTSDEGSIFIFDVLRLKTRWQTDLFTDTFGHKGKKGHEFFQKDFELSMLAAWTEGELVSCIPKNTNRDWYMLKPLGFAPMMVLFAVNRGQEIMTKNNKLSKELLKEIVPSRYLTEYQLLSFSFNSKNIKKIELNNNIISSPTSSLKKAV